jgi:hypothetical protein
MAIMIRTKYGYRPMAGTVLNVPPVGVTFESMFIPAVQSAGVNQKAADRMNEISRAAHARRCREAGHEVRYYSDPPKVDTGKSYGFKPHPEGTPRPYDAPFKAETYLLSAGKSSTMLVRTGRESKPSNITHTGRADRRQWTNGAE